MVGAGIVMVLCYPIDWSRADGASGDSPFHYPLTGGLAWLLVVATGVMAALLAIERDVASRLPPIALVIATTTASVLLTVQLVAGGRTITDPTTVRVDRGPGMWLALIASLSACAGAVMTWRTSHRPNGA